jgi:hypothetical protein
LQAEAEAIVDEVRQGRYKRIFLLHGFRPAKESILLDRLNASLQRVDSLCRQCEAMGSYYNRISVFEPRR